jgi:hypothetical protein
MADPAERTRDIHCKIPAGTRMTARHDLIHKTVERHPLLADVYLWVASRSRAVLPVPGAPRISRLSPRSNHGRSGQAAPGRWRPTRMAGRHLGRVLGSDRMRA